MFNPARFGTPEGVVEQTAIWGNPITVSTLYLHGTTDGCIALDTETAKAIPAFLGPGSEVELVEGVGHFYLVEKPTEINERILRFLQRA